MNRRPRRLSPDLYIGPHRIFVTMCTFGRRPLFAIEDTVVQTRDQLLLPAAAQGVEVLAYCFMPDHLHALIAGTTDDADLQRFLTRFRQRSGHDYHERHGTRLWQEGYFDRHLRDREDTFDVVCYVVSNPVRAGICRSPGEYPFSGSSRYELSEIVEGVQWKPDSLG